MCLAEQYRVAALCGFVDTIARYLERSGDWPVVLTLYIQSTVDETERPALISLTQHAHRWKAFVYSGDYTIAAHMSLSEFHFPLLAELDIHTSEQEKMSSDLVFFEHAPKLCALATTEVPTSKGPYHQLRHLKLLNSYSGLVEMLHKCPSLESLELEGGRDGYDLEHSAHYISRNITSLAIKREHGRSYLDLVLLSFDLPSLDAIVLDGHQGHWPTEPFVSFISRSSCVITKFILRGCIYILDLDLITALQVMPSLLHLEIEDYNWAFAWQPPKCAITSNLISSLIQHESTSTSLVPKLHTLRLVSYLNTGTFDDSAFVNMVQSRWFRPGSDRSAAMSMIGRGCIRSVVLKFNRRKVDAEVYKPLRILDKEGLRIVVAGKNGIQV
jgi:hypothetical protein